MVSRYPLILIALIRIPIPRPPPFSDSLFEIVRIPRPLCNSQFEDEKKRNVTQTNSKNPTGTRRVYSNNPWGVILVIHLLVSTGEWKGEKYKGKCILFGPEGNSKYDMLRLPIILFLISFSEKVNTICNYD